MNKRASVLIMTFLIVIVFAILASALFLKAINENNLANRYVNSTRAFWLAEAGVAESLANMPTVATMSGNLDGDSNYSYSATSTKLTSIPPFDYYEINSTGSVTAPSAGTLTRAIQAVAKVQPADASPFQHAIRTNGDLIVKGSADIYPNEEEYAQKNTTWNFQELFGYNVEEMRALADRTYNDPPKNITPVEGVTWVNVPDGEVFEITTTTWRGGMGADGGMCEGDPENMECIDNTDNGAILIVDGDVKITGGTFYGILYVMEELWLGAGNPNIHGAVMVECGSTIDTTLTGNVEIWYNEAAIKNALDNLPPHGIEIVSWKEQ